MKILYALSDHINSTLQFLRIAPMLKEHQIRIAAYQRALNIINIDYNLSCIKPFIGTSEDISFNDNYKYYKSEIIKFAPDLIISDADIYTGLAATELGIPLLQISPFLLYDAVSLSFQQKLNIKRYGYSKFKQKIKTQTIKRQIAEYATNYILSHFCDVVDRPVLKEGFNWSRPPHVVAEITERSRTNVFLSSNDKQIFDNIKYSCGTLFVPYTYEKYPGWNVNSIYDADQYPKALRSTGFFICDGNPINLADCFYNKRFCNMYPSRNREGLIYNALTEYYKIGWIDSVLLNGKEIDVNKDSTINDIDNIIGNL